MKILQLLPTFAFLHLAVQSAPAQNPSMILAPEIHAKALIILRESLALADDPAQFWVAMHAAEGLTLGGYGEETIPLLASRLATEQDDQRRCGLARELVRAGHREALPTLVEVLKSGDSYGHTHAAESLYKVLEVGDEATMRERFLHGGTPKLRLMAAAALARTLHDADALAFIRESLLGEDPEGIQISSWILAVIGDQSDIEPIRGRLDDAPTPLIRAYVEHALASLGDPDGLARLAQNLSDEDPLIRTYAATFAGDARAVSTQPLLEAMLDDPFSDARVRAAQTLLQLSRP